MPEHFEYIIKKDNDDTMIKLDDDIMFSGGEFRIQ